MNTLIEKNILSEMQCGSNFSYILNETNTFLSTEYKVLQSQSNGCFVKCMKMLYNGKIQLFYLAKDFKPFSSMIPSLDADSLLTIISNLFSDIIDVKHNGFLSCQNIDISFEHIYIDPNTYKVNLVYLPISKRVYDSYAIFENEIRTKLVKLISSIPALSSNKTILLSSNLSDGTLSLEDLCNSLKGNKSSIKTETSVAPSTRVGEFSMIAMNAPFRVEVSVTKDDFIIGKNPSMVDGAITFNKMISRVHCKINKANTGYTITDLQSANGTYVNRKRLQPNQPYSVKNGDVIRLANSDFQVSIK